MRNPHPRRIGFRGQNRLAAKNDGDRKGARPTTAFLRFGTVPWDTNRLLCRIAEVGATPNDAVVIPCDLASSKRTA